MKYLLFLLSWCILSPLAQAQTLLSSAPNSFRLLLKKQYSLPITPKNTTEETSPIRSHSKLSANYSPYSAPIQPLDEINATRFRHTKNGSIALTSWAGANIIAGTVGYFTAPAGEWKHFHEMNVYFNIVNIGLGIPGLFAKRSKQMGLSFEQTVKAQQQIETVYLVNGVLDLTYITAGFLMRETAKNQSSDADRDRWNGFGTSMIAQGGFLLIFDFIKYGIHKHNGKQLDGHWQKLSFSPTGAFGLGLDIRYNVCQDSRPTTPTVSFF